VALGGRRPGAGRPTGSANKATADIRALAQKWGPASVDKLAELAGVAKGQPAESEAARVAALKELLDRGYGKSKQPLEHSVDEALEDLLDRLG
jgi:hypothetical protein